MEAASKARKAARGWVTPASKILTELCNQKGVDRATLIDAMETFDKRFGTLEESQTTVGLEIDEAALEVDIEAAAEFAEKARIPRI